jgi:hypothetical protein
LNHGEPIPNVGVEIPKGGGFSVTVGGRIKTGQLWSIQNQPLFPFKIDGRCFGQAMFDDRLGVMSAETAFRTDLQRVFKIRKLFWL